MSVKGIWHRREGKPGAFGDGYGEIDWNARERDAVREVPEAAGSDQAGSDETRPSTEARGH